jgi:REase_MTES_1575
MNSKTIDTSGKVAEEIVRMYLRAVPDLAAILKRCGSPIEQLFLVSLCSACEDTEGVHFGEYAMQKYVYSTTARSVIPFDEDDVIVCNHDASFVVAQQHHVKHESRIARLDFAAVSVGIVSNDTPPVVAASVAIELDGHDWHERTKEQAASDKSRDRALAKLGWHTLRFTGHEVYADASACVRDVVETVARLTEGKRQWFVSMGTAPKRMVPTLPSVEVQF